MKELTKVGIGIFLVCIILYIGSKWFVGFTGLDSDWFVYVTNTFLGGTIFGLILFLVSFFVPEH